MAFLSKIRTKMGVLDVKKLRTVLFEPIILFYMMSIWMQFNLFAPLLFERVCTRSHDEVVCRNLTLLNDTARTAVQEESSSLMLYSNLCLTIPSIILAPFLGHWGDSFGRKLPVLIPACGALLSAINYAVCAAVASAPAEVLLLSNLLQGITGGFTGIILGVSSWASSVSSHKTRTSRLGLIEFANLLGTAVAPAVGGLIARHAGYSWAFTLAGCLNLLQILYIVFFMQTNISPQNGGQSACRGLCTLDSLRELFTFLKVTGANLTARFTIALAALCLTVTWLVSTGTSEVRYLFIKALNLNWDVLENNLFAAEDAGIRGLTLVTILPLLKHYFHMRDFSIILCALLSKMAMFALFAASTSSTMVFLAPVAGFLSAAVSACGRSAASKSIGKTDQGKLFAALAVLENLSSLIGSLTFRNVYIATLSWFPGFSFVMADIFLCIPVVFLLCFFPTLRRAQSDDAMSRLIGDNDEATAECRPSVEILPEDDLRLT